MRLRCSKIGCPGSLVVPLSNLGAAPKPCSMPHANGHGKQAFGMYEDLVGELARRRAQIGLSQPDLDAAIGFPDGYVAKLESLARITTPATLLVWCSALGVQLSLSPAPLPDATRRVIEQRTASPYQHNQSRSRHAV